MQSAAVTEEPSQLIHPRVHTVERRATVPRLSQNKERMHAQLTTTYVVTAIDHITLKAYVEAKTSQNKTR